MRSVKVLIIGLLMSLLLGCVAAAAPSPAVIRQDAPPWPAPRDGISYIEAAGLPVRPLDDKTDPYTFQLVVIRDGVAVEVAPNIGLDRVRAWQAPVHTHDNSGQVWLEGEGNRLVTLGQFFEVWGVRFDESCLGDLCGVITVTVDGSPVANPRDLVLRSVKNELVVEVSR